MKTFGTYGPVTPERHYVVSRTEERDAFIQRVKAGHYLVIFAPRQTGKTTFLHAALDTLAAEDPIYFPIRLDFQSYRTLPVSDFYDSLCEDIQEEIGAVFQDRRTRLPEPLQLFLADTHFTNHVAFRRYLNRLATLMNEHHLIFIIDEFDGIPSAVVSDFLYTLRHIYLSRHTPRAPFSLGIVGVKSIVHLEYDASISPFNIQDEFQVPNFTREQVTELLSQYTEATGQHFAPEVIETLHKQTAGQPFLVNRFGQILTDELGVPKTETIQMEHLLTAHTQLLQEQNTHLQHLVTNIRREPRFKDVLMRIATSDTGIPFSLSDDTLNTLSMYGVIARGSDGQCEIANPIYKQAILQAFKPLINGLEQDYFPEDTDFSDYLTATGHINMEQLLDNFRDFIARVGFRILQLPETPQEFVGQDLLYAYLDQFVRSVGGAMYLEGHTGRGRIDLLILHNARKYIVETKIWEGQRRYHAGKRQLAAYLKLERTDISYYVVFDHRQHPEPRSETETVENMEIRSYVIPIVQAPPSTDRAPDRPT